MQIKKIAVSAAIVAALAVAGVSKDKPKPTCRRCHGEGTVWGGTDETPATICNRCDGSGNEPDNQEPTHER